MKKEIAIIGATGKKSGGAFIEQLSQNISTIDDMFPGGQRLIVRESSNTDIVSNYLPNAIISRGALDDLAFLENAFKDVDTVVHIAGIVYSKDVVKAAVKSKVRRVILVHTTGIYSKYKHAGEEYRIIDDYVTSLCKENNIVLSICRPTMIYGNITDNNVVKFIKMVDKLTVMPVVRGARFELQPVHYKDLGKAYYDILMNEEVTSNKNYILSGGNEIMLRDMLKAISNELGKKITFISFPYSVSMALAWLLYIVSFTTKDYREKVQRLCEPRVFSFEDAKKDFGYNPMTFEVGVVDEVKEYLISNGM